MIRVPKGPLIKRFPIFFRIFQNLTKKHSLIGFLNIFIYLFYSHMQHLTLKSNYFAILPYGPFCRQLIPSNISKTVEAADETLSNSISLMDYRFRPLRPPPPPPSKIQHSTNFIPRN